MNALLKVRSYTKNPQAIGFADAWASRYVKSVKWKRR